MAEPRINQRMTTAGNVVWTVTIGQTTYQRDSMKEIIEIMQERRDAYEPQTQAWYGEGRYMGD